MNRKLYRQILAVIISLTLIIGITSCSGKKGGGSSSKSSSASQQGDENGEIPEESSGDDTSDSSEQGEEGSLSAQSGGSSKGGASGGSSAGSGTSSSGNNPSDKLGTGTTYYVSSSGGSDANNGKSEAKPFKTVEPVNNLSLNAGDNVLFKRGDVFTGAHLAPKGSGEKSDGKWITIDAYGSGTRPLFKNAAKNLAAISLSTLGSYRGYRIRNIDIENYKLGIASMKPGSEAPLDGLRIENCSIKDISNSKGWEASPNLPENAALCWGIVLNYAKDVQIKNVSTDNCDSPIMMKCQDTLIDGFAAHNSGVQGMMMYGMYHGKGTLDNKSNVTLQNCKITGTGRMSFHLGTTGLLIENLNGFTVKNSEIAYTVNGARAFDACAMDWENNNVNCVIDNVYAHDNDGPFLLAMEHPDEPDSYGVSRNNVIKNSISVNNGRRDHTEEGSFINLSSYSKDYQAITVQNCIDIGRPGSIPGTYEHAGSKSYCATLPSDKIKASNFTSGMIDVYEDFDAAGLGGFKNTTGASVSNGHLALANGSRIRTNFSGSGYHASTYLKGNADFVFLSSDANNGYVWRFASGKLTAYKMVGGNLSKLKDVTVSGLNPNNWFRVRVDTSGGTIKTYINETLADTLTDKTFTSGSAGYNANGSAQGDQLMVYSYTNKTRKAESFNIADMASGGRLQFTGNGWHSEETSWTKQGGIGLYQFGPHGVGYIQITGSGAYIQRKTMSVKVDSGYNKITVLMTNATTSDKITIEYQKGGTWYSKELTVAVKSSDADYPFNMLIPHWRNYTLDMTGAPGWSGEITGMRLRFHGTSGYVSVKRVVISK